MNKFKTAVILAGGKSSRMKFDKQCLVIDNKRLIYEIAKKLENHFEEIIIVSNKKEHYTDCKYKVISDEIKEMGPLAGIAVSLKESCSEFVYIVGCDMPNIDDRYISYLKDKINKEIECEKDSQVYLCEFNNKIQTFQGFYKKELSNYIDSYLLTKNKKSIISFLQNVKVDYVDESTFNKNKFNSNIFMNLNTQEDLQRMNAIT